MAFDAARAIKGNKKKGNHRIRDRINIYLPQSGLFSVLFISNSAGEVNAGIRKSEW